MSLVWYDPVSALHKHQFFDPRLDFPEPEDLVTQLVPREFQQWLNWPEQFFKPWSSILSDINSESKVEFDKDKFHVNLDVQQFKPNEIAVKVNDDNTITVEGKHEERRDEHGYISRQFVRRYVLPKDHDVSRVESRLSSDGVLSITAPKVSSQEAVEKQIPITLTGQPTKPPIKDKTETK